MNSTYRDVDLRSQVYQSYIYLAPMPILYQNHSFGDSSLYYRNYEDSCSNNPPTRRRTCHLCQPSFARRSDQTSFVTATTEEFIAVPDNRRSQQPILPTRLPKPRAAAQRLLNSGLSYHMRPSTPWSKPSYDRIPGEQAFAPSDGGDESQKTIILVCRWTGSRPLDTSETISSPHVSIEPRSFRQMTDGLLLRSLLSPHLHCVNALIAHHYLINYHTNTTTTSSFPPTPQTPHTIPLYPPPSLPSSLSANIKKKFPVRVSSYV